MALDFGDSDGTSYSPYLAHSDFYLFPELIKAMSGTHFQSYYDIIHAVEGFLDSQEKDLNKSGIEVLLHHWQKCIDI